MKKRLLPALLSASLYGTLLVGPAACGGSQEPRQPPPGAREPLCTLEGCAYDAQVYRYRIGGCTYVGNLCYNGSYLTHDGECRNPIHRCPCAAREDSIAWPNSHP